MNNNDTFYSYILRLFKNKYETVKNEENWSLLELKDKNCHDYWIVLKSDKFDLNEQEGTRTMLGENLAKEADKNLSLLLLWQTEAVSDNILNKIIEIENDAFFFKKYVIAYTPKDEESILSLVGDSEFTDLLMNHEIFERLKAEESKSGEVGVYHLLYTIAHKLPFVMLDVKKIKADTNLSFYQPKESEKQLYEWMRDINPEYILKSIEAEINRNNQGQ